MDIYTKETLQFYDVLKIDNFYNKLVYVFTSKISMMIKK